MRLAILSDIHANLAALDAVRGDLPDLDEIWVLGDIVGYGPQPNEVIVALQEMGARSVLGNHDGAAIGTVDPRDFNPEAARAIEWTQAVIDDNSRAYLRSLPEVRCVNELTGVHGSPRDPIWEYITSSQLAALNFDAFDTRFCLFGHTHVPVIYRAAGDDVDTIAATPDRSISLDGGRAMLNPGSVGQPRDGNPASSYLLLDTEVAIAEFRRVSYDVSQTQRLMREAGLPARLIERLSWGR
jgi:diadenosine tetraphosphatase ApaH/serine/threonine PP2A family protein phosphatase